MIITFSGTGNTALVANELQGYLGGEIIMLEGDALLRPDKVLLEVTVGEPIVWAMPVYAWGIPPVMQHFIRQVKFKGANESPHFLVFTCGDDIGYADNCWRKHVGRRGWSPYGSFSVVMPNTYVCLKGFDVDNPELTRQKLDAMPIRIKEIADKIASKFADCDVVRGNMAWAKTAILRPLFQLLLMSPKSFSTTDGCTACGTCTQTCPMQNITMDDSDNRPRWSSHCAMCLRCYHICPHHAVAYGNATAGKGQKNIKIFKRNTCHKAL